MTVGSSLPLPVYLAVVAIEYSLSTKPMSQKTVDKKHLIDRNESEKVYQQNNQFHCWSKHSNCVMEYIIYPGLNNVIYQRWHSYSTTEGKQNAAVEVISREEEPVARENQCDGCIWFLLQLLT